MKRVLVIDDSVTIRSVTKNFLELHQYEVFTAKDGIEALEMLAKENPEIILLDVEMPRMNGFEFAEEIRNNPSYAHIPIIMITFRIEEEQKMHAEKLGIERFLGKPYHENDLLDAIESLLQV